MKDITEYLLEMRALLTQTEVLARTPGYNTEAIRDTLGALRRVTEAAENKAAFDYYTVKKKPLLPAGLTPVREVERQT